MDRIVIDRREGVFAVALNRTEKRNAFDLIMLRELAEALTAYEDDDEARCALVHARGEHFTAGLDLADAAPRLAAGEPLWPESLVDPFDLYGRPRRKPVVIAVHGYCFTAGIELMLACDIRIAAPGTIFAQLEVSRGLLPIGGATIRFPATAGWGNAMRWMLTGERFGAEEALRIGLVQEIGPLDRAFAISKAVARSAPLGVHATLTSARVAAREGAAAAARELLPEARRLMATADAREGLASLLERREPRFVGR